MTWPNDTLSNANIDQGTDKPHLARPDLNALMLMVQSILGEAPAGSLLLTNQDEGTGNGLDADTVDGEHASAFANASHNHATSNITSGELPVVRGGTGRAALQKYGVLTGGTSSTEPIIALNPGTSGHVLTSTGANSVPAFTAFPTFPTVDVHASDFYDTEINETSGSGIFNKVVDTGFGDNNFVWGISGIRRTDGGSDTITLACIDAEGFVYAPKTGAVTSSAPAPSAGQFRVYFSHSSGGNIGFRVKVWARKNL